jgi:hypothetical protein
MLYTENNFPQILENKNPRLSRQRAVTGNQHGSIHHAAESP